MNALAKVAHYEISSPALLIEEDPSPEISRPTDREFIAEWILEKEDMERRLTMQRAWRWPWIQHWALVAKYNCPRRSLWLTQGGVDQPVPNSMVRGLPINQAIVDTTPVEAARVAVAGLFSGLMSPSRPWFQLGVPGIDRDDLDRGSMLWLEHVGKLMMTTMQESTFYTAATQMIEDLFFFGTGPMILYEDDEDVISCQNPVVGEYFLIVGPTNRVEGLARLFNLTVSQMVEWFGLDNCPMEVQELWKLKGESLDQERIIAHMIEPNFAIQPPGTKRPVGKLPGKFTYKEVYWVYGASSDYPCSKRGFFELPFIAPRWWISGNDPYGRSVAMDMLGDNMQLQTETVKKGVVISKIADPPMNAPVELKNQPSSTIPGAINYTTDTTKGMKPVYEVNAQALPALTADIKEIQERIKQGYFYDLFLMLANADKTNMTAFEVAQRQQEKLQVLGPVIERFQNEAAGPAIKRIFAILQRKKDKQGNPVLPPLPKGLVGRPLQIEYVSMLAMAQRAVQTAGIERLFGMVGHVAGIVPQALDVVDWVQGIREYGDLLGVTQKIMTPPKVFKQMQEQKQAAAQQQQQAVMQSHAATEITPALTGAAQNLSNTDVGGGLNALQAMFGSSPSIGAAPSGQ